MRLAAFVVLVFSCGTLCAAQSGANWSYEGKTGPLMWGRLEPTYAACANGHEQSPLDLRGAKLNRALEPLEFHFVAGSMTLENTGRGIVAHVNPGSTMTAGGIRYQLAEIDFHHPSEHPVRGRLSDIEVDLVYRSGDGKEAIAAVRLNGEQGVPNAFLAAIWPHLPAKAGTTAKIADMVSAGGLLPADRGYWTYMGSEVTPPCTEGVRWFVFENELNMSRSQLSAFANLFKVNTRPVQDPHGRKIEANEQ